MLKNKNTLYNSNEFKLTNFEWTDYMKHNKLEEIKGIFDLLIKIREELQNCDKHNINSISIELDNPKKETIVLACGLFSHWVITYVFENKKTNKVYLLYRNCLNINGDINLYSVIPDNVKKDLHIDKIN